MQRHYCWKPRENLKKNEQRDAPPLVVNRLILPLQPDNQENQTTTTTKTTRTPRRSADWLTARRGRSTSTRQPDHQDFQDYQKAMTTKRCRTIRSCRSRLAATRARI